MAGQSVPDDPSIPAEMVVWRRVPWDETVDDDANPGQRLVEAASAIRMIARCLCTSAKRAPRSTTVSAVMRPWVWLPYELATYVLWASAS